MSHKKGVPLLSIVILVGLMIGSVFFGVVPTVQAADGSGTNVVSPTSTYVSSTGNEFTFTFSPVEVMNSGDVAIEIPSGFSAPQGAAGIAGYTTANATGGVVGNVLANANALSETGGTWSEDDGDACSSFGVSSVQSVEGGSSILCNNTGPAPDNGDSFSLQFGSNQNWSSYTQIGAWIRVSAATNATNYIRLAYDGATNMASPDQVLNLTSLAANTWTYVTMNLTAARSAVRSFGIVCVGSGCDNRAIYIDYALIGPGAPTFSGSGPWVIDVPFVSMADANTVEIIYGNGGGASGVTAPSTTGVYTATTSSRTAVTGTLTNIISHPTITVRNPVPVLASILPTSTEIESGTTTITLTGSNFVAASIAQWNGSDRATTFISSTELEMTVPLSDLTVAGTATITVFNPTPGGGTSSGQSFVVRNRIPVVTLLSPSEAFVGDATTTVTITGQYFVSGSAANWNGSPRATVFINSTTIDMSIATTDLAAAGTSTVTVTNPIPGGGTSTTSAAFVVKYRTPTIISNIPDPIFISETSVLTIAGTNFYGNSIVTFAGATLSSTTTGSTSITATVPASIASTTGAFMLVVTNQAPGGGNAATTTNVHARAPTITSLVPDTIEEGSATTSLIINGSNFIGNTTVTFDGTQLTLGATSTTVLETSIPTSLLATFGTSTVAVISPAPGGGTATSSFIISRGAVKFAFDGVPYSGTVDAPITVTVQAQRENGSVVTNYQHDVTLNVSGSASPSSVLINIINGIGTTSISDAIAETVTLSLSDTQTTELDVSATTSATFAHGAITRFVLTCPVTLNVGDRAACTVMRNDQFGNPVTTGPDATAYFYTTSTSSAAVFYDAQTAGNVVTSATIISGTSTATAWYYDEEPGLYTITASDNGAAPDGAMGTDDATSTITVNAVATRFVIIDPSDGTVDVPIAVIVRVQDNLGRLIADYQNDVTLVASSTSGQATTTSNGLVNIVNGEGVIDISDTVAETVNLSLSDTQATGLNIASSTQDVVFAPGAVTQFSLTHSGNMEQNTRKEFIAGRKDQYGNFVSASTTLAYLYASPTSTTKFYDADTGGNEITSISLTPGNATTSFWFYGNTPATTTITVSDNATTPDADTGIDDATNEIVVTPIAIRFEIMDPTDGTVDAPITVTVRALDEFGQVVPSFTEDITLLVTGSAVVNPVLVDLENGIGTTQISDTVAETVTLSLSDTQATGLIATSTQDVAFGVGAFAKLTINNIVSATAGDLTAYTVTRTDQYNNQITAGSITVNLSVSPTTTPDIFYGANSTSSPLITSLAIDSGNASAQFWYYNEVANSYQITAQSGTVIGYDDMTVLPASIAKLTMNDRTSMNPGSRIQYTVVRKDAFDNSVTTGDTTIYMYADPVGVATAFYDAAVNGTAITSIAISGGQSSQSAWYYEETGGAHTITVSDNATAPDGAAGILDATDSILVQTATGTRFVFNPDPNPLTITAGDSSLVTVQVQDDFGNVDTNYQNDVTLVTGVTSVTGSGLVDGQALIDIINGEGTIMLTDTIAETVNLALSDSQGTGLIVSDTASITWTPGAVAQFTITDQTSMVAGTSTPYVVTRKDQYGNFVTSGSNLVYLYSNSTDANARFQLTETGTSSASFAAIANGFASTTFWYYDETAGTWDITASDNATTPDGATGIADASDSLIVTPAPVVADRYTILDPADAGLSEVTVVIIQAQDADGALDTTIQEDIYLVFSTSSVSVTGKVNDRVLVDIVDGVGTVQIHDTVAETVQLSLDRITGSTSTLAITSTQDIMFFARQSSTAEVAGGGIYRAPAATVAFTGRAYPGAHVSLFARIGGQDITLERDIEVRADGTFTIDFSGALRGLESFGLAVSDKDGKIAQIKTYDMDKLTRTTEIKNLYIAPTAEVVQRTVTTGNNVGITGFAAPGSTIHTEVDGEPIDARTQVDKDGMYRLLINTKDLAYGGHVIRAKQIDKNGVESDWSPLKVFNVSRALVTRADLNNNGGIDIGDWSIFLTKFGSSNPEVRRDVDINNDGKVDISDFSIFIRSTVNR